MAFLLRRRKSSFSEASGPPKAAFPPHMAKDETDGNSGGETATTVENFPDVAQSSSSEDNPAAETSLQRREEEDDDLNRFEPGDHVYQWCSVVGIPRIFAHHGIVLHVEDIASEDNAEETEQLLTIADFSNLLLTAKDKKNDADDEGDVLADDDNDASHVEDEDSSSARVRRNSNDDPLVTDLDTTINQEEGKQTRGVIAASGVPFVQGAASSIHSSSSAATKKKSGGLRVYTTTTSREKKWHKVKYKDGWHLLKRSGTATPATSDPADLVLQRVSFLLGQSRYNCSSTDDEENENNNNSLLPKFHPIFANCECVAVWCKTGTWSTLQAASFLSHAAVGQVKGTATIAGIAAAQTVTVPASGVWGWLGYSTTVPLMTAQPLILPALCAYGAITIGGPAIYLAVAKTKWKATTERLNEAFDADSLQVALVS